MSATRYIVTRYQPPSAKQMFPRFRAYDPTREDWKVFLDWQAVGGMTDIQQHRIAAAMMAQQMGWFGKGRYIRFISIWAQVSRGGLRRLMSDMVHVEAVPINMWNASDALADREAVLSGAWIAPERIDPRDQ